MSPIELQVDANITIEVAVPDPETHEVLADANRTIEVMVPDFAVYEVEG